MKEQSGLALPEGARRGRAQSRGFTSLGRSREESPLPPTPPKKNDTRAKDRNFTRQGSGKELRCGWSKAAGIRRRETEMRPESLEPNDTGAVRCMGK